MLGKQDFVFQRIRGDVLLKNIAGTLAPLMAEKKVVLKTVAQKGYFMGESDLLKTLLMNLIDNAVKAESSAIFLSGQIEKGSYLITVADNGRGIPAEDLSRITEAFYMVDKSRSRAQHGAGLGLSIAAKIAELHHTVLEYESEVHVGTVVRFALPLERTKQETSHDK